MKLSEMSTEQGVQVMIKLAGPVGNITSDEEFYQMLRDFAAKAGDTSPIALIDEVCKRLVPVALVKHKADLYAIVAALTGKTAKKIAEQKLTETISDIKSSLDKEFLDFFT